MTFSRLMRLIRWRRFALIWLGVVLISFLCALVDTTTFVVLFLAYAFVIATIPWWARTS
jgi:hypothetical protein